MLLSVLSVVISRLSAHLRSRLQSIPPAARPFVVLGLVILGLVATASVASAVLPDRHESLAEQAGGFSLAAGAPPAWAGAGAQRTSAPRRPPTASTAPARPVATPLRPSGTGTSRPSEVGTPRRTTPTVRATPTPARPAPARPDQLPVIDSTGRAGKSIALTLDDGPAPEYTPQVLALLRQYGIKATFCLVGTEAHAFPELVRQIHAEGHLFCNHTMTHDLRLPQRRSSTIRTEMVAANQAIRAAVPDARIGYFRAPGGNWSPAVCSIAAAMNMKSLGWSVDTRDWQRPGTAVILNHVRSELAPGGVILMHDGGGDRSQTLAALRTLLPDLMAAGYRFDFPA